ncbi:MAG: rhomboid family intramembrane serine protease [Polyangiaceae bacterium]|nr:rhomboid family intramembrane serine protease [Polyangiaceae bacterium]
MDGPPAVSFAFPKPGPALWGVLGAVAAIGIVCTAAAVWVPGGANLFEALVYVPPLAFAQPWRLLTSGLLTSPAEWSHLLFSLLGLYFLGTSLETRWGPWRFLRFLALAVVLGNLTTLACSRLLPIDAAARFHPNYVYGPTAAIAAIAVAWAREFPSATVNLFLFVPLRAKVLLWITVGFSVLDLVYPSGVPEGVVAPFGGIVAGLLFAGSPSLTRALWLRLRLLALRARSKRARFEQSLITKPARRPRPGGPPLRVVPGGLEEVLKKRTPPKDKRYLN